MKPDYVTTGIVPEWGDFIEIKDEDQIEGLRRACQLARHILLMTGKTLKVMEAESVSPSAWNSKINMSPFHWNVKAELQAEIQI